jgi:hypothetical protein
MRLLISLIKVHAADGTHVAYRPKKAVFLTFLWDKKSAGLMVHLRDVFNTMFD